MDRRRHKYHNGGATDRVTRTGSQHNVRWTPTPSAETPILLSDSLLVVESPRSVTSLHHSWTLRRDVYALCLAPILADAGAPDAVLQAMQPPPPAEQPQATPFPDSTPVKTPTEVEMMFVRLPLAAVLGTALALRPRRRSQGARKVVVIQTQIMLAVVGAVIMLVVGNSLSRAFGIVGAAA